MYAFIASRIIQPLQSEDSGANGKEETLLTALQDLFLKITCQKKRTGVLAPSQFVQKLKKENELFRSSMHQDAHEFLNYTLNAIAEILLRHNKEISDQSSKSDRSGSPSSDVKPNGDDASKDKENLNRSWVHELFEGQLTNETKCLTCETVTNKEEAFLDLSVDIDQHTSLSTCLRNFSTSETLCSRNKFFCDKCRSLQEAEKRMKIKKLPNVLAVHLKRFKYQEKLQRYIKLAYRVVFPMELRLFNTSDDTEDANRLYSLSSVIVHIGGGPYHGHYIALVKSFGQWVLFDDDTVEPVEESELQRYFGDQNSPGTGYIFLYERVGFDASSIVSSMRGRTNIPERLSNVSDTYGATMVDEKADTAKPVEPTPASTSQTWPDWRSKKKDKRNSQASLSEGVTTNTPASAETTPATEQASGQKEGWGWFGGKKK
ncbi:hypothetical protein HDV05_002154 [Chytridiales sp. JEL 0842]|nr:hypothetical protein HDV05_002154 [Chytridiales sp. JEL 0842]